TARCPVDRYRFSHQETLIGPGDELHLDAEHTLGRVESIDLEARTIDVKKRSAARDLHPTSCFAQDVFRTQAQEDALLRLGEWVLGHGFDAAGAYRAARDLLLRRPPRLRKHAGGPLCRTGEETPAAVRRLALALDGGVLPVQGPPGAGKTYTAARMIVALVAAGRRVGITAQSHKVIRHLLDEVVVAPRDEGVALHCIQKIDPDRGEATPAEAITVTRNNGPVLAALRSGNV